MLLLWCWRRLLRVPWTTRRSNQSILKEISPEYALEGWCWCWSSNTWELLTHWKRPWCWEILKAGGEGDGWMASLTQWTQIWASSKSWWWTRETRSAAVHRVAKTQTWLRDWIDWTDLDISEGNSRLHRRLRGSMTYYGKYAEVSVNIVQILWAIYFMFKG